MCEVDEQLAQLIQETIQYSPESMEYQIGFTKIMLQMQQSNKIMRRRYDLDVDSYHSGLLATWIWLRKNLSNYDPDQGSIFTWFNKTLSFRILDEERKRLDREGRKSPHDFDRETGEWLDPVDKIPAPPQSSKLLEEIQEWIEKEKNNLTRNHLRNHPQANCYHLLLRRLPYYSPTPWNTMAEEFNSNAKTLSSHYQNKCLPCLKKWLQEHGYID